MVQRANPDYSPLSALKPGKGSAGVFEPFEVAALEEGKSFIAGIDEAGRGCFAGPLAVSMVVFPDQFFRHGIPESLETLNDSKKLSPSKREKLLPAIKREACFAETVYLSNRIIDSIGVNPSTEKAIQHLLQRMYRQHCLIPGQIFLDGNYHFSSLSKYNIDSVIGGDSRIFTVSAASILAKVGRDQRMLRYDRYIAGYDFGKHKGYGTALHRKNIKNLGLSTLHRKSYRINL